MSELEIKANIDLEASPDSLQKLKQQTQQAAQVSVGAMANGAVRVGGVSGQDAAAMHQLSTRITDAVKKGFENRRAGAVDVGQNQNYNLNNSLDALGATINMLTKTWAKVTLVTGAIVAAGVAFDKLDQFIHNVIFDQQRLVKEGIILEDYRLKILSLHTDHLKRQLEISQQFNESMQNASFLVEEIDRKLAESEAKAERDKDVQLAQIENRQEKEFAALERQLESAKNMGRGNFLYWGRQSGAKVDVNNTDEVLGNINRYKEFPIVVNGITKILREYRNSREILGASPYGFLQWEGEDKKYRFNNASERDTVYKQVSTSLQPIVDAIKAQAQNVVIEDTREIARRRQVQAAREIIPIQMTELRNQQGMDYQRDVSNMIGEIARAERSADASTYAIRMTQINEEFEAQTLYLKKYEALRKQAAEAGLKEISVEHRRVLENELAINKQIAAVRAGVNASVNQLLTPNSLAGLTGGVEDMAKINQANTLQKLLADFGKRSTAILNNDQMNDQQKMDAFDQSQLKLNQDIEKSAKQHAENLVLIRSHAEDYKNIMAAVNGQEKQGLETQRLYQQNLKDMLSIEEDYRSEIEAATTEEERLTAEMTKQTKQAAKRLELENGLRLAAEQYNTAKMKQDAQRNRSEKVLKTGSDVVSESAQAISDFRIKIFEGMRSGTLSAMDYEIAGQERIFKIRKAHEQAAHDQRMQDLKDYENMREQQINLEYEQATQADRQRVADLSKLLANPNLAANQRAGLQTQLQQANGNISTAENTRRTAMEEVRMNARGSVRADAAFRENMARAEARHREQISYLSAIATNTGKVVTDISASYKETSAQFFARSNLGTFGMSASPLSRAPQTPMVLADQRMLGILEMIARNTAPMRNYSNVSRYA